MSSRWKMRDIVEYLGIKFDIRQIQEEWEIIKPNMSKTGMMNACLPKEGLDRLKYFYVENPNIEPVLHDTIFEKIIKALPIKVSRATFLNLIANQCLRYHRDPDNKIHLPINDMPGSMFYDIDSQQAFPIKADGRLFRYWTAARYHTAINASCFDRTHLVVAEYHCRNSNPTKLWFNEVLVKVPKSIVFPPKISPGDSVEQAYMVTWISRMIHDGYLFSGQADKWDDDEYFYRRYELDFIDPDKGNSIFDGEYMMVVEAMRYVGIEMKKTELNERLY